MNNPHHHPSTPGYNWLALAQWEKRGIWEAAGCAGDPGAGGVAGDRRRPAAGLSGGFPKRPMADGVEFFQGRDASIAFLQRKWARELEYRLIKELWAFHGNQISVHFQYEWRNDSGNWFRSHGNQQWEFDRRD